MCTQVHRHALVLSQLPTHPGQCMFFRALNCVNIAHILQHQLSPLHGCLWASLSPTSSQMETRCLPLLPLVLYVGSMRALSQAGLENDAKGQQVSVLMEMKFTYAVHPPPEPGILSKHQSNINTLMCKGSKDSNHPEASKNQ